MLRDRKKTVDPNDVLPIPRPQSFDTGLSERPGPKKKDVNPLLCDDNGEQILEEVDLESMGEGETIRGPAWEIEVKETASVPGKWVWSAKEIGGSNRSGFQGSYSYHTSDQAYDEAVKSIRDKVETKRRVLNSETKHYLVEL